MQTQPWGFKAVSLSLLLMMLNPAGALAIGAEDRSGIQGSITDQTGATVPSVVIEIIDTDGDNISTVRSDATGHFAWHGPAGVYRLRTSVAPFADREATVTITEGETRAVDISLDPRTLYTEMTVSATRGSADSVANTASVAMVEELNGHNPRPLPTIGNLLESKPGVLVQQTTYGQVSPFLRGFTGYQVLNLVDGIRFNNSTFRSGPNQYLAFVEPSQAQRVEVLLGPAGTQYGSDSLGGTINVITLEPRFGAGRKIEQHGDFELAGASADLSPVGTGRWYLGTERFAWLLGASGRRHNDLRAGGGVDSRNVYRRLFGLGNNEIEDLLGNRQQDSGFRQYGFHSKFAARLAPDQLVSLWFQRGVQDGVRGYKDLLGGLGRVRSDFSPQVLNFLYGRYQKQQWGAFDSVTGTFSFNQQVDGSIRQNLNYSDPLTRDYSRIDAYGYSGQATTHWTRRVFASFGGDIYDERVRSTREVSGLTSGSGVAARPLYPNASSYATFGAFGQASAEILPNLKAGAGVRFTGIRFQNPRDAQFAVPASSQWFRDVTWNTSLSWKINSVFGMQGVISRGFRAPNLNDLGALGLNDLGYEIPAAEAIPAGALLSTDSAENALSKGTGLTALRPESLMNYEFGVRMTTRRFYARVQGFDAELENPIVRRTLLFSQTTVPTQLAGIPVSPVVQTTAQRQQGVIGVATAFDPRAVKAFVNDGRSRYYGIEALAKYSFASRWAVEANYSTINGRELDPNRAARRLPPQAGSVALRYTPSGRRVWWEVRGTANGAQTRLSGGDIDDERIGASRRRRDIADFFRGARVAPLLNPANGAFAPTGESLRQIQDRVLPIGATINGVAVADDNTRVPAYRSTAGWATFNIRAGMPLGEHWNVVAALENVFDGNYRVHGSGIDAPGVNAFVSFRFAF